MSVPAVALRPAVDSRPPPEPWFVEAGRQQFVPPNQPPLRLLDDGDPVPLTVAPTSARIAITVDVVPAAANPDGAADLIEQACTWAPWFAQLLVEALDGRRPLEALGRWLDEWVLAEVSRCVRLQRRARTRTAAGSSTAPAAVASLRTQLVGPGVLEAAARLRRGRRSFALAFRLTRRGQRWRCTALQAG